MTRKTKISADISKEAKAALDAYSEKHDRSRSWLLNRMILKFCVSEEVMPVVEKPKAKRFVPPMLIEINDYMSEKGVHSIDEANKFNDFYESNGWKVGKNKMKCWKAAVRNWLKGNNNGTVKNTGQKLSAYERTKQRNDAKYRQQPDECGLGVGANDGHMGRAVDEGEGRATIEHVGGGAFIDYE